VVPGICARNDSVFTCGCFQEDVLWQVGSAGLIFDKNKVYLIIDTLNNGYD
jgi:hypothetical protein